VRRPEVRGALTGALAGVDRLVLLGDLLELRQGPAREALAAAEPALRDLGTALSAGARVTIVPGNHDHRLLAPWLERRGRDRDPAALDLEAAVDWRAGEPLARVAAWLAPRGSDVHVDVAYPGCWLREDVYALHGHYSDRHATVPMFERLGAGAMARLAGERAGGPQSPDDYEAILGPMYAWLDAIAQTGGPRLGGGPATGASAPASASAWRALAGDDRRRGLRRRVLAAAFPVVVAALNRVGLGPLSTDLSSAGLRRARLAAAGEVLLRLRVQAPYVVFGHTHRAGPLPADDPAEWRTVTGASLINVGSWVQEASFVGDDPSASPYRPGFAAVVPSDVAQSPVLTNLLGSYS
jgi:predicted phosphodiesterase